MEALSTETMWFAPGLELDAKDMEPFEFDVQTSSTWFDAPCTPSRELRDTLYQYQNDGSLSSTGTRYRGAGLPSVPRITEEMRFETARPHTLDFRRVVTGGIPVVEDYEHDAAGRRTKDGAENITYTAFDLPRTVSGPDGSLIERYSYDASGNRVARISSSETTLYHGDLFELRRSTGGNSSAAVAHVMGPDGIVATVLLDTGQPPRVLYHHRDLVGSASILTGDLGGVVERQFFEPFGADVDINARPRVRPASSVDDGFTGHTLDRATGYVNAGGRMYDPRTRRFLTTDPLAGLEASQSWNPFSYVSNNPSTLTDPSGFESEPVQLVDRASEPQDMTGSYVQNRGSGGGARASDAPVASAGVGAAHQDDGGQNANGAVLTLLEAVPYIRADEGGSAADPLSAYLDAGFWEPPPAQD